MSYVPASRLHQNLICIATFVIVSSWQWIRKLDKNTQKNSIFWEDRIVLFVISVTMIVTDVTRWLSVVSVTKYGQSVTVGSSVFKGREIFCGARFQNEILAIDSSDAASNFMCRIGRILCSRFYQSLKKWWLPPFISLVSLSSAKWRRQTT